jgi:tetratricopeptide (TPR) repeat protein
VPEQTKPITPPTGWDMALEKAPQFLSVLLLFTIPFLTQLEGMDPLFPKFAVTQIIVYFMLGAWALRTYLTGKLVWVSSQALWVLLAFMVWTTVTLIYSPYPKACLWQLEDYVVYPLWYVLLTFTCLESWQAENLLVSFLVAAFGTSLWALAQVFGIGNGGWMAIVKTQFNGRPVAGLGSPDFLAGYLMLVWPLALALWMRAKNKMSGYFWGFLLTIALFSIFLTGSPAGWVGLTIGTIVFMAFILKVLRYQDLKWLTLPFVLIAASFFVPPMSINLKVFLTRSSKPVQFQEQIWNGTMEMIQKQPVLGVGHGAFAVAFPSYRPAFLMLHDPQRTSEVWYASNWILEWIAETGVIGFLLLLAYWFYVLSQWWKLYTANAISKPLVIGVFAAVVAVAADNLLDMNSYLPTTRIPLLFLAAFPVALSQRFYKMESFPIQRKELDLTRWRIYLLPILLLLVGMVFQRVEDAFQRQGADLDMKKASIVTTLGKWDDAIDLYGKVLKLDPQDVAAQYFRGSAYLDRNHPGDMDKALADFNAVGQIMPDYKLIHYQKYEVLLRLNHQEEAEAELKRAVRLDPMLVYLLDDFKKARSLTSAGHLEEALIIYQNLYFDYPTCVPMMIDYANCLAIAGSCQSAVKLYQQALEFDPGNTKAMNNLQKVWNVLRLSKGLGTPKANILGRELE